MGVIHMKTMLVVDDSGYFRKVIKVFVSNLDIKIVGEATNGKEAVELYKKLMPDIVTLDLAMEEEDGISALGKIIDHNPEAVVIVISSVAKQDVVISESLAKGAKKVFDKPIDKDKFIKYIEELING
jgi:two-component system chemotaxis response regulator CheY